MSLSLDTVMTVASLVRRAVEIYNRIDGWPDQMKKLGRRMKNLDVYLAELEEIVAKKANNAFIRLFSTQKKHLGLLLQDIRKDTESVNELFRKWENDIGPLGFQFRFKTLTQAYFSLGSSSDKIAALVEDLNEHLQGIRDYLTLMGFKAAVLIGERQNAQAALPPVLGKPGTVPANEKKGDKNKRKAPSPSPSPAPPRRDFRIIFVDPANLARSVVGEALGHLMREWTKESKGDWRIATIHSAGLIVKGTDVPEIDTAKRTVAGGLHPISLALDAVFDNKNFDFPAKKDVHITMLKKRSIGIKKDIFKKYDYILVFTSRDHENLLKIKSALAEQDGQEAVSARGKGRVLHLGSYLTLDGIPREIEDPRKVTKAPNVTRADWNWKAAQIKLALKEFLKQEMQWKQPLQKPSERKLDTVVLLKQGPNWNQPPLKAEEKKAADKNDAEKTAVQKVTQKAVEKKGTGNGPSDKKQVDKKPVEKKPAQKKMDDKKPPPEKEGKSQAK